MRTGKGEAGSPGTARHRFALLWFLLTRRNRKRKTGCLAKRCPRTEGGERKGSLGFKLFLLRQRKAPFPCIPPLLYPLRAADPSASLLLSNRIKRLRFHLRFHRRAEPCHQPARGKGNELRSARRTPAAPRFGHLLPEFALDTDTGAVPSRGCSPRGGPRSRGARPAGAGAFPGPARSAHRPGSAAPPAHPPRAAPAAPASGLPRGTGLPPLPEGLRGPPCPRTFLAGGRGGARAARPRRPGGGGGGGGPSGPGEEGEGCRKPGARCSPGHLLFFERFQLGLNERMCLRDLSQNRSGFSILGYSRNPYFFRRKTS